jgi:hypothetical protein
MLHSTIIKRGVRVSYCCVSTSPARISPAVGNTIEFILSSKINVSTFQKINYELQQEMRRNGDTVPFAQVRASVHVRGWHLRGCFVRGQQSHRLSPGRYDR